MEIRRGMSSTQTGPFVRKTIDNLDIVIPSCFILLWSYFFYRLTRGSNSSSAVGIQKHFDFKRVDIAKDQMFS